MPFFKRTNTGELHDRSRAYSTYTNMYTKDYYKSRDLSLPCYNPWKDIVAPPMINDENMKSWHERSSRDKSLILERTSLATFRGTIIDKPGGWHDQIHLLQLESSYRDHDPFQYAVSLVLETLIQLNVL